MSKKRRIFDIELPDDLPEDLPVDPPEEGPASAAAEDEMPPLETKSAFGRRGPMATAIGENADALRRRRLQESAIREENDALAHEFVRLKKLGLITDLIPIDAVQTNKLIRDRSRRLDLELDDLKASILAVGLSNPIRVEQVAPGVYELVQGWRRLNAYRELLVETKDPRFAHIPAGLMPKGEALDDLYRRMVDENMVRKDISWAEMANLARAYAGDEATGCPDLDTAVNLLFATASPQKRSYIRRFAFLMQQLEKVLEHPEQIPRALGLEVAHRLESEPGTTRDLVNALQAAGRHSAEEEVAILREFVKSPAAISPRGNRGRGRPAKRGKTTLRLPVALGEVKCTASDGKVELQYARDFSSIERERLEAAIEAFFAALEGKGA
ncbi:ParB/RepB/Spo0J family partition protein [Halodurantibacterium flavum]|uniref:ParB/RepB/Spo0J family partition protein n=1 Tax=Halodurantibacterium flavum TaxID=1382802 RepID=A0ABW4RZJ5_9RHOB